MGQCGGRSPEECLTAGHLHVAFVSRQPFGDVTSSLGMLHTLGVRCSQLVLVRLTCVGDQIWRRRRPWSELHYNVCNVCHSTIIVYVLLAWVYFIHLVGLSAGAYPIFVTSAACKIGLIHYSAVERRHDDV